LSRQLPDKVK